MGQYFSLERVANNFTKIIASLPTTILIVAVGLLIGVVLGIFIAFIRIHKIPVLHQIATVYVSFIRGTPQIVQLFIVYYGVPLLCDALFGWNLNRVDALYFVLIAYGISESAVLSELFRGGLESVPAGQYEAGYTIGLTKLQTFFRIIIPQAIRAILPGFGVEIVSLFQGTSLASSLGVIEMMGRAQMLGVATYHYTEAYACAAIMFIIISAVLEVLFQHLNKRLAYN